MRAQFLLLRRSHCLRRTWPARRRRQCERGNEQELCSKSIPPPTAYEWTAGTARECDGRAWQRVQRAARLGPAEK